MLTIGYGIGKSYQKYKGLLENNEVRFSYLCDARWKELGNTYDGISVISPEMLSQMKEVQVIVMVMEQRAFGEIVRFLEDANISYKPLEIALLEMKQTKMIRLTGQAAQNHILTDIGKALQDSESRILFDARMRMSISGNPGELYKTLIHFPRRRGILPVSESYYCDLNDDLLETVRKLLTYQDMAERKKVILCRTSVESYAWVKALQLKLDAVLEESRRPNLFPEYPQIDIETAVEKYSEAIFISGNTCDEVIKNKLISKGISRGNFKKRHTCWKSQYFDEPFIRPSEHEVFVDAGVLDLNNTFDFIRLCKGKYDQVYALEPDGKLYENCLKRLEQEGKSESGKIKLFHAAAWSSDTELEFEGLNVGGARFRIRAKVK